MRLPWVRLHTCYYVLLQPMCCMLAMQGIITSEYAIYATVWHRYSAFYDMRKGMSLGVTQHHSTSLDITRLSTYGNLV